MGLKLRIVSPGRGEEWDGEMERYVARLGSMSNGDILEDYNT